MKLLKYKCDRCGKIYNELMELQGVSVRCVERVWDICPECLEKFREFMGAK